MRLTRSSTPKIRLDERPRPDARGERVYRQAVAQEMLSARESARSRTLDSALESASNSDDPRWRLARETQHSLQGAVLAFEDRRRLLALAQRTGIRAFDANLIIALVQDRVRRGEPVEDAAATIAIVPKPEARRIPGPAPMARLADRTTTAMPEPAGRLARLLIAAVILAMAADAMLIAWLAFG